ncbi:hypothetical protein TNCV_84901 [Trichonephila clavipes]|nr:hypothetical protein TNCV_84901 [Trichonephila clavipes]
MCIIEWTWSAKIPLYLSQVILPFRVAIEPAEKDETIAHIMTDSPHETQSHACTDVFQTSIRPIAGKSVKDYLSNHITFFHSSIDLVL